MVPNMGRPRERGLNFLAVYAGRGRNLALGLSPFSISTPAASNTCRSCSRYRLIVRGQKAMEDIV